MLIFYASNEDIVDIEKPVRICPIFFIVDKFSGLLLHPSIFSTIYSRSVIPLNNVDSFLTVR